MTQQFEDGRKEIPDTKKTFQNEIDSSNLLTSANETLKKLCGFIALKREIISRDT